MSQSRLEVRQLRAFVALADAKRVTAAARALGVAQSTLSETLAALERALGTEVFTRGRLSAAGEALLPHARAILDAVDNAHLAVAAATNAARGAVRIVANESVSTYVLPAALAELRTRWPPSRAKHPAIDELLDAVRRASQAP